MMNWTMNEQTIRQMEFYVARMQHARRKTDVSLREVIAGLFSHEKDSAIAPAYMKPLAIPMDSAYVLADYIIDLTGKQCDMTELFLEDQTAAIDQWLIEVVDDCASAQELVERYHLIEQGLKRTAEAFRNGRAAPSAPIEPYEGNVSIEAAYAMRGRIVSMVTAMNPSEEALRRMGRQLRDAKFGSVARFEHFAHGGMEIKAMTAAVVYALRCDGSLPAEADEIMLEQIVCEVCRDVDMQAVADTMQLSQDAYSTVYVMMSGVFVVSVAAMLFAVAKGTSTAAIGAAIAANPAAAIVTAFVAAAVMPVVFDLVVSMIQDTAAGAANYARAHEKEIMAAKQAARAAREKCAAVFEKVADYAKANVIEPVREKIGQHKQQNVQQQAEQTTQA